MDLVPTEAAEYTCEQLREVNRILPLTNFYEILGVAQDATECEIDTAFKKLAFLVHPDRNRAPGATAAAQAVVGAYTTLANPTTRRRYDKKLRASPPSPQKPPPPAQKPPPPAQTPQQAQQIREQTFDLFYDGVPLAILVTLGAVGLYCFVQAWRGPQEPAQAQGKKDGAGGSARRN